MSLRWKSNLLQGDNLQSFKVLCLLCLHASSLSLSLSLSLLLSVSFSCRFFLQPKNTNAKFSYLCKDHINQNTSLSLSFSLSLSLSLSLPLSLYPSFSLSLSVALCFSLPLLIYFFLQPRHMNAKFAYLYKDHIYQNLKWTDALDIEKRKQCQVSLLIKAIYTSTALKNWSIHFLIKYFR